ncbi:MAG TPA: SusC/RagA family TonB-linked outer membrane protein, partial [Flavisolibacter sp.]|nr:SusC/RagA family TonB-linked outer membrane protein [Flavisolibacter sp.]
TQRRKEVTSAVDHVGPADFNQGGARNAMDLIQGKVAGLTITRTGSSNPNSGVSIQLRGVTSLVGNLSPLIVIDGIPGGNLDLLQQDDIESFDVLKDGSAAAIYGTRANGGVILITTKKGRSGPARFDYSTYVRKEYMTRRPDFLTASQYRQKIAEGVIPAQYGTGIFGYNSDFFNDLINHDNLSQYHNLALSGGSANTTYRGSLYYNDFQGIGLMNNRKQFGTRISLNHRGFNDRLSAQVNVVTNFNRANLLGGGGWEDQLVRIPTLSNYNPDGTFFFQPTNTNQYARLFQQENRRDQATSSMDAKFSLELIKGLRASVFASIQRDSYIDNFYADIASEQSVENPVTAAGGTAAFPGASASKSTSLTTNYAIEPTIEYTRKISSNHTITAFGGYSYQYNVTENFNASNSGFNNDAFLNNNLNAGNQLAAGRAGMGSFKEDNKLIAFFGRINYAFTDKYYASLILRHEGSSRFGKNHKWGNFPAASVGWNIMREGFMSGVSFFNNLKLRAGYGVTGNSGIPNYRSLVTLGTGGFYFYPDGSLGQTYGPSRNPNPDLRWEKKAEVNIGVDFSMLKNRLGGSIEFFKRKTSDLLESYNTQLPSFIQSTLFTNVGTIENKGIELTLNINPIAGKNFTWSTDITASTTANKLVKFSNDLFKITFKTYGGIGGFGALGDAIRTVEGGKLGNFYGKRFAGFDPNGKWLYYKADGKTKVPFSQITGDDLSVIGNGIPKFYVSWTNDFTYKNFDFRFFFRGRFGNQILNTMEIAYGTKASLPNNVLNSAFTRNAQLNDTYSYSDYYLEPGGFLKLDNVTLGYKFKLSTSYIRNLRIYASGVNLLTITKYRGNDPDFVNDTGLGAGIDGRGPYPSTRQYTVGLNVGF